MKKDLDLVDKIKDEFILNCKNYLSNTQPEVFQDTWFNG
jgi:hypothetical protein